MITILATFGAVIIIALILIITVALAMHFRIQQLNYNQEKQDIKRLADTAVNNHHYQRGLHDAQDNNLVYVLMTEASDRIVFIRLHVCSSHEEAKELIKSVSLKSNDTWSNSGEIVISSEATYIKLPKRNEAI